MEQPRKSTSDGLTLPVLLPLGQHSTIGLEFRACWGHLPNDRDGRLSLSLSPIPLLSLSPSIPSHPLSRSFPSPTNAQVSLTTAFIFGSERRDGARLRGFGGLNFGNFHPTAKPWGQSLIEPIRPRVQIEAKKMISQETNSLYHKSLFHIC